MIALIYLIIMIVWLILGVIESRDRNLWPGLRWQAVAWILFALLGYTVYNGGGR